MTTISKAANEAKVATDAKLATKEENQVKVGAKALQSGQKPVKLEDLIKLVSENSKLVKNRETILQHLDWLQELEVTESADPVQSHRSVNSITLADSKGTRYEITNASLLLCVIIEIKAQLKTKLREIESALLK